MDRIDDKLLFYETLDPEERAEVDAYIQQHPELAVVLEETRRLGHLFREARAMMEEPVQDDALVYYTVMRCYSRQAAPPVLEEMLERVEARISEDPALKARYEQFEERLQALEAESDAAAQFERLAGFSLEGTGDASEGTASAEPAPVYRLPRPARWAAAAVVAILTLYGVLYATSTLLTPEHEHLAAIEQSELSIEGFEARSRGGLTGGAAESIDILYVDTLIQLRDARRSFLGLFPRYDEEVLRSSERQLERVIDEAEPGSFLHLDATYFLGKVQLAQGRVEEAQSNLQQVVHGEGRMSGEAYAILVELAAEDAYE